MSKTVGVAYAGKLLADLGAETIKVEPPEGDPLRRVGPFAGGEANGENSLMFVYANSNKKSVVADLETDEGVRVLKGLVRTADVLMTEVCPGELAAKGLSYDALKEDNPGLIMVSVTPFGESGPYKDHVATPFVTAHMSGNTVLYPHGTDDQEKAPTLMGGNFEEYDVGCALLPGIQGALYWREKTGEGQYVEVAALEARFLNLMAETSKYPVYRQNYDRDGTIQRLQASLSFPTKDGWLCPFLNQTHEFASLAKLIGKEEWVDEPWFSDIPERRRRHREIMDAMEEWGLRHTTREAERLLQEARVPISPVETPKDVVESEHLRERGYFATAEHPAVGTFSYPGRPFIMSRTPIVYERMAPLLGQDAEELFSELTEADQEQKKVIP